MTPLIDHHLLSLREHHASCASSRGRLFNVRCFLESLHGFLAPRFVTTLAFASVVLMLSGSL